MEKLTIQAIYDEDAVKWIHTTLSNYQSTTVKDLITAIEMADTIINACKEAYETEQSK